MNYIVFENEGEIDARSIKTFGVSVKEHDNPIGYFGTGSKYAIAILLRTDHSIEIHAGVNCHKFNLKATEIRGKKFDVITMDGEELSFTTELGKKWEMWQAFREIYCNCIDERGRVYLTDLIPVATPGITRVIVAGRDFERTYMDRDQIILNAKPELLRSSVGDCELYKMQSKNLFYRTIRVMALPKKAILTYNITGELELTEDRTVKYDSNAFSRMIRCIAGSKDREMIYTVITCSDDYMEYDLNFKILDHWQECVSEEFAEVVAGEYKKNNDRMNRTAREYHRTLMNKSASKHFEPIEMTEVEQKQLKRCTKILSKIYRDFDDYEIMVVKTLGQTTMALADAHTSTMVISRDCFALGTKFLMSTLIEEYAHLKTKHADRTRELQTWLFDQICTMVEDYVIKEPI